MEAKEEQLPSFLRFKRLLRNNKNLHAKALIAVNGHLRRWRHSRLCLLLNSLKLQRLARNIQLIQGIVPGSNQCHPSSEIAHHARNFIVCIKDTRKIIIKISFGHSRWLRKLMLCEVEDRIQVRQQGKLHGGITFRWREGVFLETFRRNLQIYVELIDPNSQQAQLRS